MELSFLYSIPRTGWLDALFLGITKVTGSIGQLWLIIAVILLIFRKTRKTGAGVLISYAGVLIIGELILKHLVTRLRPCQIDQAFEMLVLCPASSSFPSTHSAWSFGAATVIFIYHKKAGVVAFIGAALIAFSRMYLFLHFPTDVLAGIVLGVVMGILAAWICNCVWRKFGWGDEQEAVHQ